MLYASTEDRWAVPSNPPTTYMWSFSRATPAPAETRAASYTTALSIRVLQRNMVAGGSLRGEGKRRTGQGNPRLAGETGKALHLLNSEPNPLHEQKDGGRTWEREARAVPATQSAAGQQPRVPPSPQRSPLGCEMPSGYRAVSCLVLSVV